MAFRRGILEGIETLDQLLSADTKYIPIKLEFSETLIFLAAGPCGLTVTQEPLRATALTTYVSLRGQKIATDLSHKIGKDAACSLMNHDPHSRTLEKYYLLLEDTLDVSGLSLDELGGEDGGHTEEMLKTGNDLALHVLTDERARKVYGPALNALMHKMMMGDDDYPALAMEKELRNYKRRRVSRLDMSRLSQWVLNKARQNLAAPVSTNEDNGEGDDPDSAVDENTGLFIHNVEELPEEDLDEQVDRAAGGAINRELDEGDPGDEDDDIPYMAAAKTFMQAILDNPMSEYRNLRRDGIPCPRCQEDDTIGRELKIPALSPEAEVACPYCKELGDKTTFFHVKALIKHITYGKHSPEHDRLKRADGWYDDGWD
ncbi:hypothetical protein F53441_1076 [Fusarium austroafricanum]|uniref:Uncharacterized protein n=1 Tax=Fusarium austroafricanum TaxID=2364996 RepID=A0A8H4KSX8_9HYPO|nr:hypothetical protein F53441_1076 [Fusarium austroafricanum]